MIKKFKTTQALAFILNILLARNTLVQQKARGITHNKLKGVEVKKSDPFLEATVQANFEFCEHIPGFISELLCTYVPLFEKICSDNCGLAEDDDNDDSDDNTTTLASLNAIMQQEERLDEMVQANFEFCESIPGFISELICTYVPLFIFFASMCVELCLMTTTRPAHPQHHYRQQHHHHPHQWAVWVSCRRSAADKNWEVRRLSSFCLSIFSRSATCCKKFFRS